MDEDLYDEILRQEAEDDERYEQNLGKKVIKEERRLPDVNKSFARFKEEIAPVIETRRRIAAGLPPTKNPFRNLILKLVGKDKIKDRPVDIVNPSAGMIPIDPPNPPSQ